MQKRICRLDSKWFPQKTIWRLLLHVSLNKGWTGTLNPLDYSIWDILQELVYEERREPFANLKDLQNVITDKWHNVDDQTMRCSGKGV